MAIAFGVRTTGGRYVFPLDIEERIDDRERKILARLERLQAAAQAARERPGEGLMAGKGPVGFGRRDDAGASQTAPRRRRRSRRVPRSSTTRSRPGCSPSARHGATRARSGSC